MNNIQMSNVCFVPLSYLFLRGQGIKTFSLVLRIFRQENYIFPVVKEAENEHEGFEGAIVFEPVPGIYYSPLTTLDYASLYPRSIIQKNISHETILNDSKYDNLPDYKYFNAKFKTGDGSIEKRRFA
jgi:DNA polymerase elongation subunit (family B)